MNNAPIDGEPEPLVRPSLLPLGQRQGSVSSRAPRLVPGLSPFMNFGIDRQETVCYRHALRYLVANTGLTVGSNPLHFRRWNERESTCI